MHDARDPKQCRRTSPSTASSSKQDGRPYLIMTDGHILRRTADEPTQIIAFDKYAVDLDRFEEKTDGAPRPQAARALLRRARQSRADERSAIKNEPEPFTRRVA